MKRNIILLIFIFLFSSLSCFPVRERKTEIETFTIKSDINTIYVETVNGNIELKEADELTEDNGTIDVTVEKTAYARNEIAAQRVIDKIKITRLDGDVYKIIIDVPERYRTGASITLENVRNKQVILKTTNGNIEVEKFSSDLFDLETTTGNLYIKVMGDSQVDGSLVASEGSIFLDLSKDVSCKTAMTTKKGSINVDDAGDNIYDYETIENYHNVSANFSLNEGQGDITAETEVGSIDVTLF